MMAMEIVEDSEDDLSEVAAESNNKSVIDYVRSIMYGENSS